MNIWVQGGRETGKLFRLESGTDKQKIPEKGYSAASRAVRVISLVMATAFFGVR